MTAEVSITREKGWRRYEHAYWEIPIVDAVGTGVTLTGIEMRCVLKPQAGGTTLRQKTTSGAKVLPKSGETTTARIEWGGEEVEDLEAEYDDLPARVYYYELWDDDSHLLMAYGDAYLGEGSLPSA